jgi:hypothetical protein
MASKEIPAIQTEINDPSTGITSNHAQRITGPVLNAFLQDMVTASKITTVADWTALKALVDAGSLIPGHQYRFTFHTTYIQPVTNTLKVASGEDLVLVADSASSFAPYARSINYPQDIIHFDFTNVLCENGTTPRQGKITFRHDTLSDNLYPGDLRKILLPFWVIDRAAFPTWATSVFYTPGTIINQSGALYRCRIMHSATVFATDQAAYMWEKVDSLHSNLIWNTTANLLGGSNNIYTSGSVVELPIFTLCTGCHIEGVTDDYSVRHVMIKGSNYVKVGPGSDKVIIYNSSGIPGVLGTMSQPCDYTIVGSFSSENIITDGVGTIIGNSTSGTFKGAGSRTNTIGHNCIGIYIGEGCTYNTIASDCVNLYVNTYSHFNTIGTFGQFLYIDEYTRNSRIASSCANLILRTSSDNQFESSCTDNKIRYGVQNFFYAGCTFISSDQGASDYGQFSFNTFGAGTTGITLNSGSKIYRSQIGAKCSTITLAAGAYIDSTTIGNGCSTIILGAGANILNSAIESGCTSITLGSSTHFGDVTIGQESTNMTWGSGNNMSRVSFGKQAQTVSIGNSNVISQTTFAHGLQSFTMGNTSSITDCLIGPSFTGATIGTSGAAYLIQCHIGTTCQGLTCQGGGSYSTLTSVTIGDGCQNLTFNNGKSFTSLVICSGTTNKTYSANLTNVNFAVAHTGALTFTTNFTTTPVACTGNNGTNYYYWAVSGGGVGTLTQFPT